MISLNQIKTQKLIWKLAKKIIKTEFILLLGKKKEHIVANTKLTKELHNK